jgi:hypothetical protein
MKNYAIISSVSLDNKLNITEKVKQDFDIFLLSYKDHDLVKEKYFYANKINKLDTSASGMKYNDIYHHFSFNLFEQYKYIYIPDDDTSLDFQELKFFLDIMEEENIDLAQFSLSSDSLASHSITFNHLDSVYRITNFIEGMSPIFSRYAFRKVYETFPINKSSWGLDYLWCHILKDKKIAICDKFQMKHWGKPMSNYGNDGVMRAMNDLHNIVNHYKIDQKHKIFFIKR